MRIINDLHYSKRRDATDQVCIWLPKESAFPVFVYFHGGGLESGSLKSADAFAPYLAERGIATVSINYRMYPDAVFPDFLCDGAMAVKWAKEKMQEFGETSEIFVGGSSAGGYMSMMLCFDRSYLEAVGLSPLDVAGYIHDAGQPTTHFNVLRERGLDTRRVIVDKAAPMYFVGLEPSYPPMQFIVSDNDMEARLEQTELMMRTLSHFGYDKEKIHYKLMHGKHCTYIGARDAEGNSILGTLVFDFISKYRKNS